MTKLIQILIVIFLIAYAMVVVTLHYQNDFNKSVLPQNLGGKMVDSGNVSIKH
jgi:maltodextrin utilization protein YvdJ